jgi:hypothetical protein
MPFSVAGAESAWSANREGLREGLPYHQSSRWRMDSERRAEPRHIPVAEFARIRGAAHPNSGEFGYGADFS